ncbi:MAG: NotI family restriction endonuclease [Candidatus Uhrbacteria bacterium]|nr:NotI family restriction endonuclease [Candidatus Uhrbacteria bacterium]
MKVNSKNNQKELFAEVFGYPVANKAKKAIETRREGYCPFLNGPCQKSTYQDKKGVRRPMGVCSMFHHGDKLAITCPHRLKEDGLIFKAALDFAFPDAPSDEVLYIPEVRLPTKRGRAGNLDYLLVRHKNGVVRDFAGMELQTVYFSGSGIRNLFIDYIENQAKGAAASPKQTGKQHPDYRSSSKKRLLPQLIEKGPIFSTWKKRFCVAIHEDFYAHLLQSVTLKEVPKKRADFAWIVVGFKKSADGKRMKLGIARMVYCNFHSVLDAFLLSPDDVPPAGEFFSLIQTRVENILKR